jgi:predicted transcriptional regulator
MEQSKKIMAGALVIAIFTLMVSLITWYIQGLIYAGNVCSCFIPLPIFIPLIGSIGLLIGILVYYLFSPKFERKIDKKIILGLFDGPGADILNCLIENNSEASQSHIVKKTGISKVRVHRTLEKLKKSGIIEKKSDGKTNHIILKKEIAEMLGLRKQ